MNTIEISSSDIPSDKFQTIRYLSLIINILATIYLSAGTYYLDGSFTFPVLFLIETIIFVILTKLRFINLTFCWIGFRLLIMAFLISHLHAGINALKDARENQRVHIQKLSMTEP